MTSDEKTWYSIALMANVIVNWFPNTFPYAYSIFSLRLNENQYMNTEYVKSSQV